MRVNITPDCETFRVSPMDRSRRDIVKIAQHFSGGWVSERRYRPARDDRIVFCLLNPPLQEQTKLEPKSESYAGRFYRPYRDGTFIHRFHTQHSKCWATFVVSLRDQSVRGLSPERGRKCYVHADGR